MVIQLLLLLLLFIFFFFFYDVCQQICIQWKQVPYLKPKTRCAYKDEHFYNGSKLG